MKRVPSFEMRLLPAHRSLRLVCALLVFVSQGCGKEQTSTPDEQIREGWKRYRLSEFSEALGIFESVEASQPRGSRAYLQSLYGQASCWNHRRDGRETAKAISHYQEVIAQAPDDPLAAWCALDIVRAQHLAPADQSIDYPQLIRDYAGVYARYPQTPAGEEAFLYKSSLAVHLVDAEKARTLLAEIRQFVASHPTTPFLAQFYDIMAECCHKLNEEDRRLEYLVKSVEARPVDPASPLDDRSTAYWKIAYAAEFDAGNFALAREYYQRLISEYPKDIRIFGARKALERMDAIEAALREGRPLTGELLAGHPCAGSLKHAQ
jgi:tetratricopeptide (TPR) repeat protein